MKTIEVVQKAVTLDVEHPSLVLEAPFWKPGDDWWMPSGWKKIFSEFVFALYELEGEVQQVYYSKGTLQVKTKTLEQYEIAIRWLSQGLAKQSSMTCMVCGKYGVRRKMYDGLPSLCGNHFIEYANELAEGESNVEEG